MTSKAELNRIETKILDSKPITRQRNLLTNQKTAYNARLRRFAICANPTKYVTRFAG